MVQTIIWSPQALQSFINIMEYLQAEWTDREVTEFAERVDKTLAILQRHPRIGTIRNKRHNIYRTLIRKDVVLIYKHRPLKKELVLLRFWSTYQKPQTK